MYQSSKLQRGPLPVASRGDSPVSIIGAGIAGAWQALLFAQAGHDVTLHERSDAAMTLSTSHWAGGMLAPWCESRGRRTRHQPARPALARSVARAIAGYPVQRLAGGGASARPQRFRTLCAADDRPPAARCAGAGRTRTLAGGPFPRRAVLRRRRPCRAAPRAAETARTHHRRRRHHPVQQRARGRRSRRHRDRLPRPRRARHAAGAARRQGRDDPRRDRRGRNCRARCG